MANSLWHFHLLEKNINMRFKMCVLFLFFSNIQRNVGEEWVGELDKGVEDEFVDTLPTLMPALKKK